ncbi:MAG: ribose 5-phosphate isomerase B [Phycisphaeraceae bacterium]|nr:ribose 5-phosphate isomerase B [Phycisphaeraceae bacterium]
MKVALAADHGGYPLKAEIAELVKSLGHEVLDLGAHQFDKDDDYPDFARYIGQAIQHGQAECGVLLCGSGVGASIAANKMKGVRAAVCHDAYSAAQGVEHDDMNVLCLGSRIIGGAVADVLVRSFLGATFIAEGKYQRRLDKVLGIEAAG